MVGRTRRWSLAATVAAAFPLVGATAVPVSAAAQPVADLAAEATALAAALAADATAVTVDSPPAALMPAALMPSVALIFDGAAAWFSDRQALQAGGHDPRRSGFSLQQLELHLESNVDPYLRFQSSIVWGEAGTELEEGFAQTLALPANLQVRAGKFLAPFGRLNPTHPHSWHFVDAPFAVTKMLGADGSRGLGAEVAWLAPLPWFMEARLALSHPDAEAGRSFAGPDPKPLRTLGDLVWTGNLRQFFALGDDWSLYWGLSTQQGSGPVPAATVTRIWGGDLYLRWRPVADPDRRAVSLQVEAIGRQRHWFQQSVADWAAYAQVIADLSPAWQLGGRLEWGSGVRNDPLDPEWDAARQRHALQLSRHISHFARLRLQLAIDKPTWRPEPIYAGMLAVETVIGAHGAHDY